jgi:hypothetical protein
VAFAAEPTTTIPAVTDVALKDGGVLNGQVVDLRGSGVTGVSVTLGTQNKEVAATTTSAEGRFAVSGLRGGIYHVAAAEGHGVYRLWSAGTAPPSAQNSILVYTQDEEQNRSGLKMLLANPIVIAGLVATAVAVPLALSHSHPASP